MNSKLTHKVHGPSFVELRRARGWSQEELSRRAGYSERVIRKAEAGGTLRTSTLLNICEAFSETQGSVTIEDLTCSIVTVAKSVVEAYDNHAREMLKYCGADLTEDFVYTIHADPARVPYGGSWHGLTGMQRMLDIFFDMFTRRPGTLDVAYLVGTNRVHARFLDQAMFKGEETPPIIINLHLEFRGMKVCKMDNEFDSDLTVNTLTKIENAT